MPWRALLRGLPVGGLERSWGLPPRRVLSPPGGKGVLARGCGVFGWRGGLLQKRMPIPSRRGPNAVGPPVVVVAFGLALGGCPARVASRMPVSAALTSDPVGVWPRPGSGLVPTRQPSPGSLPAVQRGRPGSNRPTPGSQPTSEGVPTGPLRRRRLPEARSFRRPANGVAPPVSHWR